MKIEEILIIGINPDYRDTILSTLPLEGHSILDVDIYQMEINSDLKIVFYDLDLDHKIPEEFLEHIKPHLSGILIIGDSSFSLQSIPKRDFVNNLIIELGHIPVVVAVGLNGEDQDTISENIEVSGLYLSKNSKLFLWNPDNVNSIKKVWRSLLVDLQEKNKQPNN